MERLWTPWRMQYIAGDKQNDCIFCSALKRNDDRETYIVQRRAHSFVILNKYPYNNGHLMVVPYQHTAELSALAPEALSEMIAGVKDAVGWLRAASGPEGFNVGLNLGRAAGAGVRDHLHFHIVPRWLGDTSFMSVTAETRVIPESLDDTWKRLRAVVEQY